MGRHRPFWPQGGTSRQYIQVGPAEAQYPEEEATMASVERMRPYCRENAFCTHVLYQITGMAAKRGF